MRGVAAWAFLMCGSAAAAAPAPDGMVDSQVAPGVSIELAHADVIEHALADWLRRHPERLPRLDGLSIRLSPPPAAPHDTQGVYLRLPGGRWRVEPLDWRRAWPVAATCTGALLVAACPPVTIPVVLLRYAWELRRDPSSWSRDPNPFWTIRYACEDSARSLLACMVCAACPAVPVLFWGHPHAAFGWWTMLGPVSAATTLLQPWWRALAQRDALFDALDAAFPAPPVRSARERQMSY